MGEHRTMRQRLTAARKRRKEFRAKQAAELAARHDNARKGYLSLLQAGAMTGHVYAGTANRNAVRKRRAKNRVAKQSRKVNR